LASTRGTPENDRRVDANIVDGPIARATMRCTGDGKKTGSLAGMFLGAIRRRVCSSIGAAGSALAAFACLVARNPEPICAARWTALSPLVPSDSASAPNRRVLAIRHSL